MARDEDAFTMPPGFPFADVLIGGGPPDDVIGFPIAEPLGTPGDCPKCGSKQLFTISVMVHSRFLRGDGSGIGTYIGCPCCPFATKMLVRATPRCGFTGYTGGRSFRCAHGMGHVDQHGPDPKEPCKWCLAVKGRCKAHELESE